jgi:hypothetical protein
MPLKNFREEVVVEMQNEGWERDTSVSEPVET